MGFNIVALAQKPRTRTLIVDSDLDMGNYDLIATDVKGDTAEFSEFVGGVGNFTSGLFSGGVDVSGILHAEGNTQVDGNLLLEGSINNVNIDDNGDITTAGVLTGSNIDELGIYIPSTTTNTNTGVIYATASTESIAVSTTSTSPSIYTVNGYTVQPTPIKLSTGVYTNKVIDSDNLLSTRTMFIDSNSISNSTLYIKRTTDENYSSYSFSNQGVRVTVDVGVEYEYYVVKASSSTAITGSIDARTIYIAN